MANCPGPVTVETRGRNDGLSVRCPNRDFHTETENEEGWVIGEWCGMYPSPERIMQAKTRHDLGAEPVNAIPNEQFNDGFN